MATIVGLYIGRCDVCEGDFAQLHLTEAPLPCAEKAVPFPVRVNISYAYVCIACKCRCHNIRHSEARRYTKAAVVDS